MRKRAAERSRAGGYREHRGLVAVRELPLRACPVCKGTRLVARGATFYSCWKCIPSSTDGSTA